MKFLKNIFLIIRMFFFKKNLTWACGHTEINISKISMYFIICNIIYFDISMKFISMTTFSS